MKAFKYVGPVDEVDVALPDGTHQQLKVGDTIEVDDDQAGGFTGDAWEKAKATTREVKGNG